MRTSTAAFLESSAHRLTRCSYLLGRLTRACAAWNKGKVQNARQIADTVNELLITKCFLKDPLCHRSEYEVPLADIGKTIDFLFHTAEGSRVSYDVKTVLPDDRDATERYNKAMSGGGFSPGTAPNLRGELNGTLGHYQSASRQNCLDHILEREQEIQCAPDGEDGRTYFRMVFCSDGFRWCRDQREDFAETYFAQYNPWDHIAEMEAHSLREKGRTLDGTIHGFCYFERGPKVFEPSEFRCDVRVSGSGG